MEIVLRGLVNLMIVAIIIGACQHAVKLIVQIAQRIHKDAVVDKCHMSLLAFEIYVIVMSFGILFKFMI